jgi:hypothetical protein
VPFCKRYERKEKTGKRKKKEKKYIKGGRGGTFQSSLRRSPWPIRGLPKGVRPSLSSSRWQTGHTGQGHPLPRATVLLQHAFIPGRPIPMPALNPNLLSTPPRLLNPLDLLPLLSLFPSSKCHQAACKSARNPADSGCLRQWFRYNLSTPRLPSGSNPPIFSPCTSLTSWFSPVCPRVTRSSLTRSYRPRLQLRRAIA